MTADLYEPADFADDQSSGVLGQLSTIAGIDMSDNDQRPYQRDEEQSEEWPAKMRMSLAHKFLGVSHAKLTSLVQTGVIPHEKDPLDHRVKLVRKSDLERLRRESSGK
jgi:hypothetical protein